jgi:hypothetical protein
MYPAKVQSESIEQLLFRLETDMLTSLTPHNPNALLNLLAEDFCEFGSSGRIYSRDDIVTALQTQSSQHFVVTDFSVKILSESAALATYQVAQSEPGKETSRSLRSSLWVLRDSRWQMLFHQGTKTGP